MSSVFSDYVRSLEAGKEPLDRARFEALLGTLRQALVYEMKVRSLWTVPPSYLGVHGPSWNDESSLEDLLLDCYQFIFIRRLQGLINQAAMRSNIDGLIFLNIRHFLHDTQKRHDPLGFRVFEVAHGAVASLVEEGELHVLAGDERIRNETVLGFSPWTESQDADEVELEPLIVPWNNELMPDLLIAWSKEDVQNRLAALVARLGTDVAAFRFIDLITPLKEDARARWQSVERGEEGELAFEDSEEGTIALVRRVHPELGFEDRESFEALLDCMEKSLEKRRDREKTRLYLARLWLFLRSWARESQGDDPAVTVDPAVDGAVEPELEKVAAEGILDEASFPSHKRLGELLEIPRGRIPELLATLGAMIEACFAADSAKSPVKRATGTETSPPNGGAKAQRRDPIAMDETYERLCRRTDERAAELAARRRELPGQSQDPPRPGDVFLLPETRSLAVEWLVVERHPNEDRLAVLPLDDHPLVGGNDLELGGRDAPRRLRCGLGLLWLDPARLRSPWRTDRLEPAVLDDIERRRDALAVAEGSSPRDQDPEYRAWSDALAQAVAELSRAQVLPFTPRPATATPLAQRSRGYALAAVLALATVGASLWGLRQQQKLEAHLDEPIVVEGSSRFESIHFGETQRGLDILRTEVDQPYIWLYLVMRDIDPMASYRFLLVTEPDKRTEWESDDRKPADEYLLALPRRRLDESASYTLQLWGNQGGRWQQLDEQRLNISFNTETEPLSP